MKKIIRMTNYRSNNLKKKRRIRLNFETCLFTMIFLIFQSEIYYFRIIKQPGNIYIYLDRNRKNWNMEKQKSIPTNILFMVDRRAWME